MSKGTSLVEFDTKYDIIDAPTPRHTVLSGRYKRSFAYYTLRERLPVILTQVIDQLTKDKDEIANEFGGEECREDIKLIVGHISKLKYQLQTDKAFEPFNGSEPDKELWNNFIGALSADGSSFFRACWLYAECYMYRKVSSFFENSKTLKTYDYFVKQKRQDLKIDEILDVAKVIADLKKDQKTFVDLLKLNLWGNKCDLSLIVSKEFKPSDNVFAEVNSYDNNLLVDHTQNIWRCLEAADRKKPVIVEIVNDNAGFEFCTDLIIADYLIQHNLANTVRFNVKPIPWYVSDVTPSDVTWTLDFLKKHESKVLQNLGNKWQQYFKDGKFVLNPVNYFWVSPYEYYKMREIDKELYRQLAEAYLVIFKGDLNYRKLLGDMCWDPTDDFLTCIRGFQPTNICSLRTVKADLICGLPQGKAEELNRIDNRWMCTGEYGVIQFMEKPSCCCNNSQNK